MRVALGLLAVGPGSLPLAALAVLFAAPARAIVVPDGAGRVPSQVLIHADLPRGAFQRCGGTVRDALHVLTAAHCTYDRAGRALGPGALRVTAGVWRAGGQASTAQRRAVVAISSDPQFARTGISAVHDDAILRLERPLQLRRPTIVAAAPLAAPGERASTATFAGWGRTSSHGLGGTLHHATVDVLGPGACRRYGARFRAASMICARRLHADGRATGGCNGDSGGGLLYDGRLLGIASFVGPWRCGDARFPTVFTRVGAPAIHAFLRGREPLPRPVVLERPRLTGDAGEMRCVAGRTTGTTSLTYAFKRVPLVGHSADPSRGVVVAPFSPSDTYVPITRDIGAAIFCIVRAVNSGGAATAISANGISLVGSVSAR